jgi:predicted Zn-dependent peptidase
LNYKHTIIYYGPLSIDSAAQMISHYHPLPDDYKVPATPEKFSQVDQKVPAVLFADYEMVQAEIMWVRNMGPYNPSNTAIIDFFNEYYGGGMGSVVFQTLRESKALAYGTYAFYGSPEKKGERYSMTAYIGCQADKLKDAVEGMNELFNKMPRSEKLIETSRKSIKNQYETQRFTEDEVIDEWFAAQELGLDRDIRPQVYAQFDQLDYPALLKFEKENIAGKPFTYCVVASSKKIKMDLLAKYGKVKRLKPEEIFGY